MEKRRKKEKRMGPRWHMQLLLMHVSHSISGLEPGSDGGDGGGTCFIAVICAMLYIWRLCLEKQPCVA